MFDAKALLEQLARGAGQAETPQSGDKSSGDLLGQIQSNIGQISAGGAGGIAGMVGQVLGQAVQGVKEGAGRIDAATGASEKLAQNTGQTPDQLAARARDLVANNQLAAGAMLGGLGALVLGTKTGRNMAGDVAKLGALALIGGLAYKAYQNHQAGKPILGGSASQAPSAAAPAPQGSGFEGAAMTNDGAMRMVSAMIAAAAADGRIDDEERQRILGAIDQARVDDEARRFLAREIESPSTPAAIAKGVHNREEAAQIYTSARLAIVPDSQAEQTFLAELARELRIEPGLAQQIDIAARGASA